MLFMDNVAQKYRLTVGMEVHAELKTRTKMFCGCPNNPDSEKPNSYVCPVCMGHPGTLPVPNKLAVGEVIRAGLALGCDISEISQFDRKNYFYPDLPKGYQISQFFQPFCEKGELSIPGYKGEVGFAVRIKEIHLEEDTGKLIHPVGANYSLVDYNRAGVPLMELVTEPDIHSARDAKRFCEELQLILKYLEVSDADMEKGHMRCEANISIAPITDDPEKITKLGVKVEVKNLNSFKAVERAIAYEYERQEELIDSGGSVAQETRGWDDLKEETYSQRSKEQAHDYRYFTEPDISPIRVSKTQEVQDGSKLAEEPINIGSLHSTLPELPNQKRTRFAAEFGIGSDEIEIFVRDRKLGVYYEDVASELASEHDRGEYASLDAPRRLPDSSQAAVEKEEKDHYMKLNLLAANYLINELPRALSENGMHWEQLKITPSNFAEFILRVEKGIISSAAAKTVLSEMVRTGDDPDHIIADKNLAQMSDETDLDNAVSKVIESNAAVAQDFKSGKQNALQFLIGQTMKETKGKANPKVVQDLLRKKLQS
jgi:aspartyl-tRNA(Asn)/glutamyl-tRNA(Gln) amidotransferase subunit B